MVIDTSMRIDRVTTRTGDGGQSGLADGSRRSKSDPLFVAIGDVDEVNSLLGVVATQALSDDVLREINRIQNDLFDLGGDLAMPPGGPYEDKIHRISPSQVQRLEDAVERASAQVLPLRSFVLPGGSPGAAWLHLLRTVVRRAERAVVNAEIAEPARAWNPAVRQYLNRLSDLCFAWARLANDGGKTDVLWVPGANR